MIRTELKAGSPMQIRGMLDDKQGGGTIVTMERVREAIAFKAMQSWQTSQHGCGSYQSE